jgi:septum formation protein
VLEQVRSHLIILASKSPRRQDLLAQANIPFIAISSDADERIPYRANIEQYARDIALRKVNSVTKRIESEVKLRNLPVLGADTIVSIDGERFGKPADVEEARYMLRRLSGRTHQVCTGVVVWSVAGIRSFGETTDVTFYDLDDEEIDAYIRTGEPFDKAGAYGIQGLGAMLVKRVDGDYNNVVGLPLARTLRELAALYETLGDDPAMAPRRKRRCRR